MAWSSGKPVRLFLPAFDEVFIRGEAFERFETCHKMISHQESLQMLFEVVVGLIGVFLHGGVVARAAHAFDLAIRPGVVGCGQPMGDPTLLTDTIAHVKECGLITLAVGELDAMIGQDSVDLIGYSGDQVA